MRPRRDSSRGPAPGAVVTEGARHRARCVAECARAVRADELVTSLAASFSDCTSFAFEFQVSDVIGDMAYTAGFEHTSASVNGEPRTYTLRATQVYRREDGAWKVAHRHGDTVIE